jgi:5-methylcytosine-specific restriction endonuclease McrA
MLIYNRVLQDGSGSSNYGLEVAKYLKLPDDFLEDANNLRLKYFLQKNDEGSVLSLKTSHYNSKKLLGLCEICKKEKGTEVHHLIHQQESNEKGVITTDDGAVLFHKNHIANLISICEKCHLQMHSSQLKIVKNTKETTDEAVSEITVEGTVERTVERTVEGVTTVEGISESILKEEVKKVSKKKKTTKGIILTES